MELNEMQKWVHEFNKKEGWLESSAFLDSNFLLEEAGEVAREVRRMEVGRHAHVEPMTMDEKKKKMAEEIGDTLTVLATIANRYGITLEECFMTHKEKMIKEYGDVKKSSD